MGHRELPFAARTVTVSGLGLPEVMGQPALQFSKLTGKEALCELFEYKLELRTPDERNALYGPGPNLDTSALRGQELTVTIALDGSGTGLDGGLGAGKREITGLVTDIRGPIVEGDGQQIAYRLTLRPWLWLTTLNRAYRIFQQQSVVEILDTLLSDYTFPVERRLDVARYPKREFQVQYGESDFAFFQRLTQEWGISWHIEHSDGKHRLVLTDGNGCFTQFASEAYHSIRWQPSADRIDEEHLHAFEWHDRVVSGQWTSNDYDFVKPKADLTVRSSDPLETAHADAEVREWPGDHAQPATGNDPWREGDQIARLRMEALRQHGRRASGAGNVRAMVPGCTFKLTHFLQNDANREYLILGTHLLIEDVPEASGGGQTWRCEVSFTAQPTNELYRPERTQPKPRTTGPQTATVVGPPNQETWTDEFGRVKLQFHWDRIGQRDASSSCWVRASSPWQGERFGAIQIPRIGQEVIVDFLNGDPDCPIITGRVPNRDTMPQWPLPQHHALSGQVSKELHGSRTNTFVQDDTEGQIQTQLQSDHQTSWLSLGFITRIIRGVGRKDKRGEGFELRTDGHGAVRGGDGLLISTEAQPDARAHHKDMGETVARLDRAQHAHNTTGQLAQHHNAQDAEQQDVAQALKAQHDEIRGSGEAHGELTAPHLVLASPAGMAATTAQSTQLHSGEHLAVTTGKHASFVSHGGFFASATRRIALFAHSLGIKLVAATDHIALEAQDGDIKGTARRNIHFRALGDIVFEADQGIVFKVGQTYQRWTPQQIIEGMSGPKQIHAGAYRVDKPDGMSLDALSLPHSDFDQAVYLHLPDGSPAANRKFRLTQADGSVLEGVTGPDGLTKLRQSPGSENLQIQILDLLHGN
nr:type VI secretion system tip protein TssI/VgrG [uncultured Ralstonia sp.]